MKTPPPPPASAPAPAPGRRVARFVAVGTAAAAVHWAVVTAVVSSRGWPPLAANVLGWLVALTVSFVGHHRMTFRGHGLRWWRTAPRFAAISALGFGVNEAAYAAMLRWSGQPYQLALAIVLVAVAALTYLLSSRWAFLRPPGDGADGPAQNV
ncbi:GtrA family protein [Mitsuaria sp. GD03876]|uniref:GtrA family protein n=1 Tax=Mitsuaria sp. GD03876 TaxID=2975399 RepID=UPI002447D54C|nr:GtrA family protein [Mitsuaria sp. GD03876]MDH0868037.1 GtrA family protein [Mitsuaria sp. GD03876]